MKLGSSLRRRRGQSGKPPSGTNPDGGSGWFSGFSGPGFWLLVALGAVLLGTGGGYLYATQLVFPVPEREAVDLREVPDLRGLTFEEAILTLEDEGLTAGAVDSIRHPAVAEGRVMGQSPFPGQRALPGGPVEFTLSLGPERRPVPDVSRLIAGRALTVLQTTGFEVEVDSVEAEAPMGRVVRTEPAAGEEVMLPAVVRMSVSLGPPLVELPLLVGMQEEQAVAILDSLGLDVGRLDTRFRFGFNQGEVVDQSPEAGEEVPRGSVVHLEVGRRGLIRDPDD